MTAATDNKRETELSIMDKNQGKTVIRKIGYIMQALIYEMIVNRNEKTADLLLYMVNTIISMLNPKYKGDISELIAVMDKKLMILSYLLESMGQQECGLKLFKNYTEYIKSRGKYRKMIENKQSVSSGVYSFS